jgi:hypothetical protein
MNEEMRMKNEEALCLLPLTRSRGRVSSFFILLSSFAFARRGDEPHYKSPIKK